MPRGPKKADPSKPSQRDRLKTTTVDIDRALKTEIQVLAVQLGLSLREITEEALRRYRPELEKQIAKKRS